MKKNTLEKSNFYDWKLKKSNNDSILDKNNVNKNWPAQNEERFKKQRNTYGSILTKTKCGYVGI